MSFVFNLTLNVFRFLFALVLSVFRSYFAVQRFKSENSTYIIFTIFL